MTPSDIREEHREAGLDRADLDADPMKQFARWMHEASALDLGEPTAATLATVNGTGHPSGRIVLIKEWDRSGFIFFTNYESRKGRQLEANPHAALVCYWPPLERQVLITGSVSQISAEDSDAYFRTRPRDSQLGAWASEQSSVIATRELLEDQFLAASERYRDREVPRPPTWGGYRLSPQTIEFWQGRSSRLHDRLEYTRQPDGSWVIERLSP